MIHAQQITVFYAPTARRRFITRKAAIKREATAILVRKYPMEQSRYDNLGMTEPGFHWSEDERLVRLHARLIRILSRTNPPQTLTPGEPLNPLPTTER